MNQFRVEALADTPYIRKRPKLSSGGNSPRATILSQERSCRDSVNACRVAKRVREVCEEFDEDISHAFESDMSGRS